MVVFEAVDERVDLTRVAELAGLEILTEVERDYDPDFPRKTVNQDLPVNGCLHAVCINEQSKANILGQWRRWQQTGQVDTGYAPLRDLFAHLKDVRPWGPQDRILVAELASALSGMLPGDHTVEIELQPPAAALLDRTDQPCALRDATLQPVRGRPRSRIVWWTQDYAADHEAA